MNCTKQKLCSHSFCSILLDAGICFIGEVFHQAECNHESSDKRKHNYKYDNNSGFTLAVAIPAWLYRNRRGMKVFGV